MLTIDGTEPLTDDDLLRDRAAWRDYELAEDETITGTIRRLPEHGRFYGSRLFIETEAGILAVPATAKSGHTVLESKLAKSGATVGQIIDLTYRGTRVSESGRTYRHYGLSFRLSERG